jgi:6-phosphogluconate dehydrogenase
MRRFHDDSKDVFMQLGMIGLGRMGANMVRRLMRGGHECVVSDVSADAVAQLVKEGAVGSSSLEDFAAKLTAPRAICLMVPAAIVDAILDKLVPLLGKDDVVIDGGNSHYHDDIARAKRLQPKGIHYVDMGTSGGVWGLERGYCLMIGGEQDVVSRLDPIFTSLSPGPGQIARTPGREKLGGTAEHGYLHCGPSGGGHFVKMIHNGIEYGMMAAFAEGLNILKHADTGTRAHEHEKDAETTPLRHPEHYQYDFNLADITELWRRGSVVSSWLLDLTAQALASDPALDRFGGQVSDSGEGRWTVAAANDLGVPAHVLTASLFERFASRDLDLFQNKVLSAMRFGFGGHLEKKK